MYGRYFSKLVFTVLTAAFAISLPSLTAAEVLLSLEDAIDIALEQGYDMKTQRLALIRAEQNRLAAKYRFRTNIDMTLNTPSWSENVREVQVPDGLPVYNSLGTFRYQGTLNINQPLPTDGRITLRSRMYQSRESNYYVETDNTLKRKDFLSSFSISLNQPLFTYNRIKTNLKRAELNYERTSLALKRNRLDVVYRVSSAFYNLYSATRSREIAQETLDQQQLQYDTAKSKYDAGLIPEVEALRLEVELANARSQLFEAQANLERQKESFKQLIGIDLNEDIGAKTEIDYSHIDIGLEEALRIGLANRTELRENEIEIALNQINLKEVDADREISANLSAYYDFTGRSDPSLPYGTGTRDLFDSSLDDLERRPGNRGVTLTFDIPIFDWGVNKAEVESAKASLRQSEIQAEEEKKTVITSITDAVRQVRAAENRLQVLEKSQEVAQRTYDISLERFNNGVITSLDLAQDNRSLSSAKLQYLAAYISYKLAISDLKRKTLHDFETNESLVE